MATVVQIVTRMPPGENPVHVLVLDDAELTAIKHALVRFAMEPASEIAGGDINNPVNITLWHNWRKAISLDLQLRGYGLP